MMPGKPIIRLIAAGLVLLLVIGAIYFASSYFTNKKELRVQKGQAGAAIDAGAEAMNAVSNVAAADAETERTVKAATAEVRAAPAGNSNAAAQRGACSMKAYRDTERCKPKVTK